LWQKKCCSSLESVGAEGADLDSLPAEGSACGGSLGAVLAVVDAWCGGVAKVAKAAHGLAVDAGGEGRQVSLAGLEFLREALGGSGGGRDDGSATQVGQAVEAAVQLGGGLGHSGDGSNNNSQELHGDFGMKSFKLA